MKISIIIATLNSGAVLDRALNSIWKQTYPMIEVLIVDGGSTDNTNQIINSQMDRRLAWSISEKDESLYEAWNKALAKITGDWVLFLGSDDELADERVLEQFVAHVKRQKRKYTLIYGKVKHGKRSGRGFVVGGEPWPVTKKKLYCTGGMMAHQGVFHSAEIFQKGERFDSSFKICGDYDLLLRVMRDQNACFISELTVAIMHYGGLSSGFNNLEFHHEFMRARKKNSCPFTFSIFLLTLRYKVRGVLIWVFGVNVAAVINEILSKLFHSKQRTDN